MENVFLFAIVAVILMLPIMHMLLISIGHNMLPAPAWCFSNDACASEKQKCQGISSTMKAAIVAIGNTFLKC